MNAMPHLAVDGQELGQFLDATCRYADPDTFLSFRAFYDDESKVFFVHGKQVGDDPAAHLPFIESLAASCTRAARPVVFAPPLATFAGPDKATESDLRNGLVLSVECDQAPAAARAKLEGLLGPATVLVASGGIWVNADGEIEDKLHLHWRLDEPTRELAEHQALKRARSLAGTLVGGDASNKPVVHCIRWPGSWHRKGTPRLARIVAITEHEVSLPDALERLQEAVDAAGLAVAGTSAPRALAPPLVPGTARRGPCPPSCGRC